MTFHIGSAHTRGAGYMINGVNLTRPFEADMVTCAHCQKLMTLGQLRDDGGWCRREMKPLCGKCADRALIFGCEPFLKTLERFTGEQLKLQQFRRVAGLDAPPPNFTPKIIITP
jgi:hypothetical protein